MIVHTLCNTYLREILEGIHQKSDVYKMALYTSAADLSSATTTYSPSGEVSGQGYTAGGKALSGFKADLSGKTAFVDFDDAEWPNASLSARGCLLYNASKNNRAVAVCDFGEDVTCTNGTFSCQLPPTTATTAFIRITR